MILGVVIPVEDGPCRGVLHIEAESTINRRNNQLEWLFGDIDTLKAVKDILFCYITSLEILVFYPNRSNFVNGYVIIKISTFLCYIIFYFALGSYYD